MTSEEIACISRSQLPHEEVNFMETESNKYNVDDLNEVVSKKLEELMKLPDDLKRNKNEDIKEMIRYYNSMSDKVEDRRIHIHVSSLQLLAISVTGLALLVSQSDAMRTTALGKLLFLPTVLIVGMVVLSSLISSLLYEMQSGFRYPFLKFDKYGNQWKWFYYGNQEILKINRNPIFKSKDPIKTKVPYLNGLSRFLSNYKNEDLSKEITDNIQQLYLLQVHNYFKNRFYLQLTVIWKWAFYAIFAIIVFFILFYLCCTCR